MYLISVSTAKASISGNSVVPGLPNTISTPSCLRSSRKARFPDIAGKIVSVGVFRELHNESPRAAKDSGLLGTNEVSHAGVSWCAAPLSNAAWSKRCRNTGLYIREPDGRGCRRGIHEHHWDREGARFQLTGWC